MVPAGTVLLVAESMTASLSTATTFTTGVPGGGGGCFFGSGFWGIVGYGMLGYGRVKFGRVLKCSVR